MSRINTWKIRPINGFEKQLFPNTQLSFHQTKHLIGRPNVDPSRFIYPRDAMGNILNRLCIFNRSHLSSVPLYFPNYNLVKVRSPVWTISNRNHGNETIPSIGPMTYDSMNDKSQLSCRYGWTQIGRQAWNKGSKPLSIPFYDLTKYKQVGDRYSKSVSVAQALTISFLNKQLLKQRLYRFHCTTMKLEICNYSGYKIYPGHGKRVVKSDGKVHIYLNAKCQRSSDMRRNPRRVTWTVYYRRKHKKGTAEHEIKKRTRRTIKSQRAITGVTWNEILAKRNQQPEFRKAQRQQAINAAKQAKKEKAQLKKVAQTANTKAGKPVKKPEKIQKNIPKTGPKKGTQR